MYIAELTLILLVALYVTLVSGAFLTVVLDNRQPVKTIAWILILLLLPVVGLLLYYFFGQNIRHRRKYTRKRAAFINASVALQREQGSNVRVLSPHVATTVQFLRKHSRALLFDDNAVEIFTEGQNMIDHLVADIRAAHHHVHLEFFVVANDTVGRLIAAELREAVARGVKVRFVYDMVGCWSVRSSFFKEMEAEGIEAMPFMPVHFRSLSHRVNYRNHRKLVIVDGQIGYIGGMNLAERYVKGNNGNPAWRDLHLRITGAAVGGMQQIFLEDWYFTSGQTIIEPTCYPKVFPAPAPTAITQQCMQIVYSTPFGKWANLQMVYSRLFHSARSYIYIQTPYFMPPESVLEALQTAALSGVRVEIMVPEHTDSRWTTWANRSFYADALRAGIDIYVYTPGMIHAKCVMIDDACASVGSANLDFRSLGQTFEDSAIIYSGELVKKLRQQYEDARKSCKRIDITLWKKRHFGKKILESAVRIFSPLF